MITGSKQVAIFGASADIATKEELCLAEKCGIALANYGFSLLVGGDDGVMGTAAQAAKNCGGTVIAILPRDKEVSRQDLFDAVIDTGLGWVQFSDVLIRSSIGGLVVGGGSGTIGELSLMYLNQFPCAFVGSKTHLAIQFGGKPFDSRGLTPLPVFDEPLDAIQYILKASIKEEIEPSYILGEAWDLHCNCYPFGDSGDYLFSGLRFQDANLYSLAQKQPQIAAKARAHIQDAIGDHFYYHVEDYFRAASHYSQALKILNDISLHDDNEFREYLTAIILECLAIGLEYINKLDLSTKLYQQASQTYQSAMNVSDKASQEFLEHSAIGLEGDVCRVTAMMQVQKGLLKEALLNVDNAQEQYEKALSFLPRWADSNLSDTYDHYSKKLALIKAEIEKVK